MQIPLLTTSVIRLPKIFNFFGRGFHPSPSTLDFNGVMVGTEATAGLDGGVTPAGLAAGVGLVAGTTGLASGAVGGVDTA